MSASINQTTSYIRKLIGEKATTAIITGSGLGGLIEALSVDKIILYSDIPHFPKSTIDGHQGCLILGKLSGKDVLVLNGRFHYYEGYSMDELIYPIRVLKKLGINLLLLSNAAGGVNPKFSIGDIMVINDHINMMPNPLIGFHNPQWGERFPDMLHAYDPILIKKAFSIAKKNKISLKKGIYLAVTGPTYETPAEYKAFRRMGADAIGMSTIPEVIAARQMGIRCFAVSIITDLGVPGKTTNITHQSVLREAAKAEKKMTGLFIKLIAAL